MGLHTTVVSALVAIVLVLAGCQRPTEMPNTRGSATTPKSTPMRVVTDDLERQVTIPVDLKRVVSTAPSVTENIFAVGAGDRLVGVTTFCDYPEQAKSIAKIGDTMNPNMESIIALKPDIVFVSTASQIEAFMKTLEANGIAVYVTNPTSLTGMLEGLEKLGDLFGTNDKVEQLVPSLAKRYMAVADKVADQRTPTVFVQISREPLFTIGKQSLLQSVIETAGGHSLTMNIVSAYPKLSTETASALNPQAILLSDSPDNQEPNEAFKNSPAMKNGRVYKINADILSRPGPRLVDALEQIAKLLHPEKFEAGAKEK
jgi:iron complex transport system substrate-binding protein